MLEDQSTPQKYRAAWGRPNTFVTSRQLESKPLIELVFRRRL
jgi:hypothetical protein